MIEIVGGGVVRLCREVAEFCMLFFDSLVGLGRGLSRFELRGRETLNQMFLVGVESLPVILACLTFVSLMMITEFSFHMKLVLRQDSLVPAFSTLIMVRELGPVLTCLLLTSRVGAGIAAEVGTMRITEQLDALRLLSIDPVEYLVIPRWIACVFASMALSIIALGVAIVGGAFIAAFNLGYPLAQYFNTMFLFSRFDDFTKCLVKAAVFGTIMTFVALHHGFRCRRGSEGVGNASTAAVVQGSLLLIAADFVLTYLQYAV